MAVERLDPRVVALVAAAVDERSGYAEIWRRVRPLLERRGFACPSYGSVRKIVREERYRRAHAPEPNVPVRADLVGGRIWTV